MAHEGLRFERFDKTRHRREGFDCGNPGLDEYLKSSLGQQIRRGVTAGYVLAASDGQIAGYFTLSNGKLPIDVIPTGHGFPGRTPLPTTLIGRLAVDRKHHGKGLGGDLLVYALQIAVEAAKSVASAVIEVDALDEPAQRFYAHFGFQRLPDDEFHLYLSMLDAQTLVKRVFGASG